jgi:hypothetical protein
MPIYPQPLPSLRLSLDLWVLISRDAAEIHVAKTSRRERSTVERLEKGCWSLACEIANLFQVDDRAAIFPLDRSADASGRRMLGGPILWLIAHTEIFLPVLLVGLMLVVELGFRVRRAAPGIGEEIQPVVESARDGLGVLLGLLLGFSLPMALPHYEQRTQLVIEEANAISTVEQRAQMFPEPFRGRILQSLPEYTDARLEFATTDLNGPAMAVAIDRAKHLQNAMWQQAVMIIQNSPNQVTPIFVQSVGQLSDLIEERRAAAEKHIPTVIWVVFILISSLTCFVVGYSMRCRVLLGMLVLPLTVAIVLSLASELDNPRAGFIRVSQQSMLRLQQDLKAEIIPAR